MATDGNPGRSRRDAMQSTQAELYKQIEATAQELADFDARERAVGLRDLAYAFRLIVGGQQPGSIPESR
jgi:hypothetical protein